MNAKIYSGLSLSRIIIVMLIIAVALSSVTDLNAKRRRKKRHYNPEKTREQTLEIIRTSSENVSQLAGLEPAVPDSAGNDIINTETQETTEGEYGENLEELEAEDDITVDLENFKMMWLSYLDDDTAEQFTAYGIKKQEIMDKIMDWVGTPYRFGGTTRNAIDCSAFTQKVFLDVADILLPRVAREQVDIGRKVKMKDLQFGDLIFFHTYSKRFASHVGIYLGDNLFAHASSRYGVTVSSLESTYYNKRFIGGRRLTPSDIAKLSIIKSDVQSASVENPGR